MPAGTTGDSGSGGALGARRAALHRLFAAGKLAGPPRRPGILERPRLVEQLLATPTVPVVLISAAAGYGKTTLLSLWRDRDQRPFAWLTLDATDNDPGVLVSGLVAALDPIVSLDDSVHEALEALETPERLAVEPLLLALVDALAQRGQPVVLALDDVDQIKERGSLRVLTYLADHLPAGSQLALATRTDPAVGLGSLRAHALLVELRAPELRLTAAEAREVLAAAGVRLSDHRLQQLLERTEGWPAGLYLAALSLRDRADADDFVDTFAGASRHVADFLSEDVLARQSPEVIRFLLRTCVLSELTAPLCDAMTASGDAQERLRELEASNLFVVPLDEERRAYRYHRLFAQYLRAELARRDPELIPTLHRRAWVWLREHDLLDRAIGHAQACGDVDAAADMVAAAYSTHVEHGNIETVRGWLTGFAPETVDRHPPLAIAAAWVAALSGESSTAFRLADAARRGSWEGPMPDGSASLESALAILSCVFGPDSVGGMRRDAQTAVDLEPPSSRYRGVALQLLGVALTLEGDLRAAHDVLTQATRLTGDRTATTATSLAFLSLVHLLSGADEEAYDCAQRAHLLVNTPRMRTALVSVAVFAVYARVLLRRGDLPGTARAVENATGLLPRLTMTFWWSMVATRILLAPALAALGRTEEARHRLREAETLLADQPDAEWLRQWHADTVDEVAGVRASVPASRELSDAERRVLRLLASNLSLREIGRELCLSLNTVKTHTHSIYRKLDVNSRHAAVVAGADRPGDDLSPG